MRKQKQKAPGSRTSEVRLSYPSALLPVGSWEPWKSNGALEKKKGTEERPFLHPEGSSWPPVAESSSGHGPGPQPAPLPRGSSKGLDGLSTAWLAMRIQGFCFGASNPSVEFGASNPSVEALALAGAVANCSQPSQLPPGVRRNQLCRQAGIPHPGTK